MYFLNELVVKVESERKKLLFLKKKFYGKFILKMYFCF